MNERFEHTAAWLEHCDGMKRFDAETEAARRQGLNRWECVGDAARRVVGKVRDQREAMAGAGGPDALSAMQPRQTKED